ncbi:MAG: UDP-N-acetylmuramoyl-L-alanyl-D-glutamate--2,6-diaminopimelate ligase [Candidatus Caenarcaniphilales bacterium]|nr:UDP-N-acetylmuramoyl-L-alanyl-D-glutamate--2,6-diaminopimelate ligase [Candidatus Caenarcaniphilales bacterium]
MTFTVKDLASLLQNNKDFSNSSELVSGLEFDSRKVHKGSAFFCIKGEKTDGHKYIKTALEGGASLVIAEKSRYDEFKDVSEKIIFVEHVRKALGLAANEFYGRISSKVNLIGITGTNGKTTTTHLVGQILSRVSGKRVGLVGTLGSKIFENGVCLEFLGEGSGRTTPEAPELHGIFKELYSKGCENIVMEVSSHSLEQGRVHGCDFRVAVFTNLTQDHLDYHVTMENYFEAKAILFKMLVDPPHSAFQAPLSHKGRKEESVLTPFSTSGRKVGDEGVPPFAILNADSQWSERILKILSKEEVKVLTYGIQDSKANLKAEQVQFKSQLIEAVINFDSQKKEKLEIPLNGEFNLYNSLAALEVALGLGFDFKKCCQALEKVESAPGRFQLIAKPESKSESGLPTCVVDYAHTPDGLENVLKTAKQIVPQGAKLISVFGCGGDRDPTKRPIMGRISTQYADLSFVTSDNPRSEDPNQIVADIMSGIASLDKVEVEIDRAQAIERAILEADPQDVIVVAGKGHEDYQIFADKTIHFLDSEEVEKAYTKRIAHQKDVK